MAQQFSEKEILADALAAEKNATNHFNTFSNECLHEDVRKTALRILEQEHAIQQDVFCMMHEKGYYPVCAAQEQKVADAKQKFSQGVKSTL